MTKINMFTENKPIIWPYFGLHVWKFGFLHDFCYEHEHPNWKWIISPYVS